MGIVKFSRIWLVRYLAFLTIAIFIIHTAFLYIHSSIFSMYMYIYMYLYIYLHIYFIYILYFI